MPAQSDGPRIAVSISPLRSLIEPMLPAGATVDIILSEQSSPHADELSPSRAEAAYRADVLVFIGAGADPSVERIARRRDSAGRVSVAITLQDGDADPHDAHDHSHDHDHALAHAWLDPHLVERAIPALRDALLVAASGSNPPFRLDAARLDAASAAVVRNVREVDRAYHQMLGALPPTRFISFHGAFDAVLEQHGLEHVGTLLSGHGAEPTPERLSLAANELRREDTILIIEATENVSSIRRLIESSGARIARLDALHPDDWETMMRANLRAIIAARTSVP